MSNIGIFLMSVIVSVNFQVEPYSNPDRGSGRMYQLVDTKGVQLIPAKFSVLTDVSHGLLLARSYNESSPRTLGNETFLFTKDGRKLDFKVPEESNFVKISWFGKQVQADPDSALESLPEDAILQFSKDGLNGLCTIRGEVLVAADYSEISPIQNGGAFLSTKSGDIARFKVLTNELYPLKIKIKDVSFLSFDEGLAPYQDPSTYSYGYITPEGNVAIEPVFHNAKAFKNGHAIVVLKDQEGEYKLRRSLIDKSGKVISPSHLNIREVAGRYAVAGTGNDVPQKLGVVDRNFQYVIKPLYRLLSPRADFSMPYGEPAFYVATLLNGGSERIILSPSGRTLFELPSDVIVVHGLKDGKFRALFDTENGKVRKSVMYDLKGNVYSTETLMPLSGVSQHQIGTDRFIRSEPLE